MTTTWFLALLLTGLGLIGLGAQRLFWPVQSAEAVGTVMSVRMTARNTACCPVVVGFVDSNGARHEFESVTGGDRGLKPDDRITVFYEPGNPSSADTGRGRNHAGVLPLAVGATALFVGGVPFIVRMRIWSRLGERFSQRHVDQPD